jgi:hypothetical protein|tara:strand:- start:1340 stop:1531 length:192 start_codon:yes stop_codon:yes gene_type:complete
VAGIYVFGFLEMWLPGRYGLELVNRWPVDTVNGARETFLWVEVWVEVNRHFNIEGGLGIQRRV